MDKLEELLPGIDRFLRDVLGKESLSKFAKAQREYYLEKIELLRLPNTAPTRPKSVLPEPPQPTSVGKRKATNGFGCDDFIAQQRALSRLTTSEPAEPEPDVYDEPASPYFPFDYHFVEDGPPALPEGPAPTEDDVYEVPVNLPDADGAMSDDSSGTSYESYEGEFDGDSTSIPYENVKISSANDEIRLPSDKSKKKSKKRSLRRRESKLSTAELSVENLKNVTHSGTLQIKQLLSWSKRFCVISDNCFLSYKNETDLKPVLKFLLFGCSVAHSEKDSKQQSRTHQLKITLPNGSDSYFFYADTKEVADEWVKQLNMCIGTTESKEETKESSSDIHLYGNIEESEKTTDAQQVSPNAQACNASLSSSEGGSGDGVMAKEESAIIVDIKEKSGSQVSEKKTKSKVLQPAKSLSSLFGNFGKKKLEKDKKKLSMEALGIDLLEADLVGYLEIICPTCGLKKWGHRWCVLRNGLLDILNVKDSGEKVTEASFTLEGCDLGSAGDSKRSLALKLMRNKEENLVTLDFQDSIEQGKWLALLAKEVGAKTQVEHEGDASSSADGSFDSHQGAPNHTYSNFADGQVTSGGGELYCNVGPDMVNAAPEGDDPMVYDEVDVSQNILSTGDDSTHTRINRMSDPPPPPPVPPPSSDDETTGVKTVQRTNSNLKNRIAALQECVAASTSPKSQVKVTEEGTSSKVTRRISLMEERDAEAKESRWEPEGRPSFTPSHKKPPNEHEEKYKELKKKLDELRIRRVQVRGRKILARDPETKESYEAELQEIEKEYSKVERQMDMLLDDFGEHKEGSSSSLDHSAIKSSRTRGRSTIDSLPKEFESTLHADVKPKSSTLPSNGRTDKAREDLTNVIGTAMGRESSGSVERASKSNKSKSLGRNPSSSPIKTSKFSEGKSDIGSTKKQMTLEVEVNSSVENESQDSSPILQELASLKTQGASIVDQMGKKFSKDGTEEEKKGKTSKSGSDHPGDSPKKKSTAREQKTGGTARTTKAGSKTGSRRTASNNNGNPAGSGKEVTSSLSRTPGGTAKTSVNKSSTLPAGSSAPSGGEKSITGGGGVKRAGSPQRTGQARKGAPMKVQDRLKLWESLNEKKDPTA